MGPLAHPETTGQFTGFWPAVLVLSVLRTPYVVVLMTAAFARCPIAEEEAARIWGLQAGVSFRLFSFPGFDPLYLFTGPHQYVRGQRFGAVAVLDCQVLTWELYKLRGARDAVILGFGLIALVIPLLAAVRILHGTTQVEVGTVNRAGYRVSLALVCSRSHGC